MPKAKQLTDSERSQIDLLRRTNLEWSQTKIANTLQRSRQIVSCLLASPQIYGKGKRTGRPRITISQDDRAIAKLATKGRKSCVNIKRSLGINASLSKINRRLTCNRHVKFGKHKSKPLLKANHKKKRLEFATRMVSVSENHWNSIIFSDEKKFNLDGPDGLKSFWYDLRREKAIFSKRHSGGGGVMIWAGFSAGGTTDIAFCEPKMNSQGYQDLLAEYLLPVGPLITSGEFIFQQDNAPAHRSQSTKSWLEVNGVTTFGWPALSPDLNPIENLWGWLSREVYEGGREFSSIADLKLAIVESWSKVTSELRKSLVGSMKTRLIKVIKAKGNSIDY